MVFYKSSELLGSLMLLHLLSTMLLQQVERVNAGCENIETALSNCQAAVEGDNPPPPTPACCTTLQSVSVGCLCEALAENVPKNINKQAALMLPSKCNVAIPPGSSCAGDCKMWVQESCAGDNRFSNEGCTPGLPKAKAYLQTRGVSNSRRSLRKQTLNGTFPLVFCNNAGNT